MAHVYSSLLICLRDQYLEVRNITSLVLSISKAQPVGCYCNLQDQGGHHLSNQYKLPWFTTCIPCYWRHISCCWRHTSGVPCCWRHISGVHFAGDIYSFLRHIQLLEGAGECTIQVNSQNLIIVKENCMDYIYYRFLQVLSITLQHTKTLQFYPFIMYT